MKLPKPLAVLLVAGVSLLLSLLAVEFLLGFFFDNQSTSATKEFDPVLGWRLIPGTHDVKPMYRLGTTQMHHNRYGLRNPEITPSPEPGVTRVLVLGDSFTYSSQQEQGELFTALLEKELAGEGSGRFEVVNAGVLGYGTGQQLLLAKRLADQGVSAQVYLLMVFTNDILDNLRLSYGNRVTEVIRPGFELDAQGRAVLAQMPVNDLAGSDSLQPLGRKGPRLFRIARSGAMAWLQTRPKLVRWLEKAGVPISVPRMPGLLNGWYEKEITEKGLPLMKALLAELKAEAASRNSRLLVAMIPSPLQVYHESYRIIMKESMPGDPMVEEWLSEPLRPQRLVGQMCSELQLPFCDLYPALKQKKERPLYLPGDGHFSPEGHRVTALALADFLLNS